MRQHTHTDQCKHTHSNSLNGGDSGNEEASGALYPDRNRDNERESETQWST